MTTTTGDIVDAGAARNDGPRHASAPAGVIMNGSIATEGDSDEDTGDGTVDEASQARFVAFVLHSLTGESSPFSRLM